MMSGDGETVAINRPNTLRKSLSDFEKHYGGTGLPRPAVAGADYRCPNCDENVRGVSGDDGSVLNCPICGDAPGALTIGRGPQ